MTLRLSWALIAAVAAVSLAIGATGDRAPRTEDDRVVAIATEVRCPTCLSLSAAESDAQAAQAVRDEIRSRLRQGESEGQIRAYLVSRYGRDILLEPEARGLQALVWAAPVVAGAVAAGGLGAVYRRRRQRQSEAVPPTAEERALVEEAMRP